MHNNYTNTTYLLFNVLLPVPTTTILETLLPALTTASVPTDSISHNIRFTGFPSMYKMDEKQATLIILDSSLANRIKTVLCQNLEFSFPT